MALVSSSTAPAAAWRGAAVRTTWRLRQPLIGSVSLAALLLAAPGVAMAQVVPPNPPCNNVSIPTVTCTGNVSAGVRINSGSNYTVLNVNTLTADIAPASGVDGIFFQSDASVTVNSDTGAFSIAVTGADADGIDARSSFFGVTVDSTGDITSAHGRGINADGREVTVTSRGTIEAELEGIRAFTPQAFVTVTSTGDITSNNSQGIYARTLFGAVTVGSTGNITSHTQGIDAGSSLGSVTVVSTGNITSTTNQGIGAFNTGGAAAVSATSIGDIHASNDGIYARSSAGAVTVRSTGNITSTTNRGIGAFNTGGAAAVSVESEGDIQANNEGIRAQSNLGSVTVGSTGNITSTTNRGIYARNSGAAAVTVESEGDIQANTEGIVALSASGSVTVDSTGNITSTTNRGIYAGNFGAAAVRVESEGDIQANNDGIRAQSLSGPVTVDSKGNITSTDGHGILAQNFGTTAVSVTSAGTIRARSDGILAGSAVGAAVTVISTGDITSDNSRGIRAFNVGAQAVSVTSTGTIQASMQGILASSLSGTVTVESTGNVTSATQSAIAVGSLGDLTVTVAGGAATGAAGAAGVEFGLAAPAGYDGASNSLTITSTGIVQNAGGITALAILGRAGNETVTNSGIVTGNVDLGGGANSFLNQSGGLFNMGPAVNLGAGNALTNSGTLSPGGTGVVATTTLTGDLVQNAGGRILVDVDLAAGTTDLLTVTGTANLSGVVAVNLLSVSAPQQVTILSATGGVTDAGLTAVGPVAASLSLLYPNANDVVLGIVVDFAPLDIGLNPNQTALADNLNVVLGAGSGGVLPVLNALVGITDPAAYIAALNQLLPEHYAQLQAAGLIGAEGFSQTMMSCRVRDGGFAFIAEGQCLWAEVGGQRARNETSAQVGSREVGHSITGGGQVALGENLRLGFAGRYEEIDQRTGTAETDGQRGHLGAALKYVSGPFLVAAALSAGRGWHDTERQLSFAGFTGLATSSHEVDYFGGLLRAAYLAEMRGWYLKPMVDLNVTRIDAEGFTEAGGGGAGLAIGSARDTFLSVTPAVEIGAEWRLSNETLVRPFLRAGVTIRDETEFALQSRFAGAPAGVPGFTTVTEIDAVTGNIAVGLDVLGTGGVDMRLHYDGSFGETTSTQSFGARASVRF